MSAADTGPTSSDSAPGEGGSPSFPELSRSAGVLIIVVALIATIASTIDVFVNGWLPAVAHIAWFIGVFLLFSLFLAALVTLVAGREPAPLSGS
ncbi:hypothetical protein [Streptomyces yaizuensis]|uniref:Uncharacterized protein n=1 Tax=Streptomyces yaizuensis TaxID=2989713 RepID=A0ABQ5P6J6_9ACTN|nr:hypothetical protein [Streptomyces sp. YSPA8]GLF98189.1 hypothetical protein SYYSPA8_27850 [Streptomyces sp. YSPA8]